MNKKELTEAVAGETGLSGAQAGAAVDAMLNAIARELAAGGDVRIMGFGNFSVAQRASRTGRNPQTGQELTIPARKLPKFSPGGPLKDAVASGDIEELSIGDFTIDP